MAAPPEDPVAPAADRDDAVLAAVAADADEAADPAADAEQRSAIVDRSGHGERLDKWLVSLAGEFSRTYLQTLIEGGQVRVDGRVATACARRLAAGQQVAVTLLPTPESRAFRPEPMALALLHEDAQLLVLDKPAGLVVHPAPGNWSGTLLNGLLAHHEAAAAPG
jgi:23S rRNA pseudouridine1911/1915/1917 synthase